MTLNDFLLGGGATLLTLMTLIQITPIKINPWSWIANTIGKAINRSLLDNVKDIGDKVDSLENRMKSLVVKVENMDSTLYKLDKRVHLVENKIILLNEQIIESEEKNEERSVILCRARILRFGDEILHEVHHSKDHFDQILIDCTTYEKYCNDHPDFENNITEQTINLITNTYADCMKYNKFL